MAFLDKERIEQSYSQNKKQLTLFEVMQSIMAAAFGVQSSRKRDLDNYPRKTFDIHTRWINFLIVIYIYSGRLCKISPSLVCRRMTLYLFYFQALYSRRHKIQIILMLHHAVAAYAVFYLFRFWSVGLTQ